VWEGWFSQGIPKLQYVNNYRRTRNFHSRSRLRLPLGKGASMDSQTNREIWFHTIGTIITVSFVISLVLVFISAIR
jgi:hypothetical protein